MSEARAKISKPVYPKKRANLHDQWIDFKYWLLTWQANMSMLSKYEGKSLTKQQKAAMQEAMGKYPWMADMMKLSAMFSRICCNRKGASLEALRLTALCSTRAAIRALQNIILDPEHTVFIHSMVPNEIFQAMGIKTCRIEQAANSLCMSDQHAEEKYLDEMYNRGLLENTCTYSTQAPGMILSGEYPTKCQAVIAAAMPCEAHFQGYGLIEKEIDAPFYWLDLPYDFDNPERLKDYVQDLKGMIAFLEEHTGHKMDWDKLRYFCENHNRVIKAELERFEYNRTDCPPLTDDGIWLSHLQCFHLESSTDEDVQLMERTAELAAKAYEKRQPMCDNLRFRTVIWSTPLFFYPGLWNWMEQCWGVAALCDMESFGQFRLIDTSTPDTMLYGLADSWCHGTMSRHLRGPVQNWIDGLNELNEQFRPDFVLNLNHNNCRSHLSMTGYITEWARQKKVPVCNVNENFYDTRVCTRQGVRDQINNFMFNVMHATPLDESLLNIDDNGEW